MKYLLHDGVFAVLEVLKREALEARNNDNGNVLIMAILANYLISKTSSSPYFLSQIENW